PVLIGLNPEREVFVRQRGPINISARIGITKAADLPLRFLLSHSPFVSRGKPSHPAPAYPA
ncbi:MAG TPA: hypothetical protein VHI52_01745, partial [Verrucomicrobiae bacterium]|nr:hypothetical protein [Verrucomicrobiae bacterium]